MNRLAGMIALVVVIVVGVAAYWSMNPHRMPRFISTSVPGLELPEPKSPMTNFRPPQF